MQQVMHPRSKCPEQVRRQATSLQKGLQTTYLAIVTFRVRMGNGRCTGGSQIRRRRGSTRCSGRIGHVQHVDIDGGRGRSRAG